MKPALALEPVHWQGEVVGYSRRLAVLALKDGRRPTKERAGENRCGRGLAREDKNPGRG
jgi:hypothetical protein